MLLREFEEAPQARVAPAPALEPVPVARPRPPSRRPAVGDARAAAQARAPTWTPPRWPKKLSAAVARFLSSEPQNPWRNFLMVGFLNARN